MKIPFFVVVLVLVIVGFIFAKSAAAVVRFSANLLTWTLILAIIVGAVWMLTHTEPIDKTQPLLESKKKEHRWR